MLAAHGCGVWDLSRDNGRARGFLRADRRLLGGPEARTREHARTAPAPEEQQFFKCGFSLLAPLPGTLPRTTRVDVRLPLRLKGRPCPDGQ